ncbi:hypothetical protein O181_114643 [Austropuccinia psidii MF-1]|uniref:Uncharacterized protein n=1 Tax=Austropuccinia psidii MF-1 TaxID=1389203 RepID=A0A9Q3K4U4_9BASI|nr:hypothetical protein [Austropuccinia psidii MF-1]
MSSKLTELTKSSPSALPPSVICGSGVFSPLSSPSMASSGHFDPFQTYDGYREDSYPFGAEFITQDLPCNFGEAKILMVLDPINGSRPYLVSFGSGPILGPLVPLGPQQNWAQGASNSPHGPWRTACGL